MKYPLVFLALDVLMVLGYAAFQLFISIRQIFTREKVHINERSRPRA